MLLNTTMRIIVGCWVVFYVSHASADSLQTQEISNQSCSSISGFYQFLGQNNDSDPRRLSFTEALFGPQIWSGKGTATELNYSPASNLLHVKIHRENLEPDPDFSPKVNCQAGVISFEYSKNGYGDGSRYETKSIFRISKDNANVLFVHKIYSIKSIGLFSSKESNGEMTTRFLPLPK